MKKQEHFLRKFDKFFKNKFSYFTINLRSDIIHNTNKTVLVFTKSEEGALHPSNESGSFSHTFMLERSLTV